MGVVRSIKGEDGKPYISLEDLINEYYKIKTEETGDFLITGFTVGEKANYIRSVSLGVYLNDHEIIHVGSCGSFASEKIKKDIYDKLSKLKVSSNFQKISSEGTPYIFVKPQVVVEVKLLEMQGDRSNDQPIRHFKYEFNNNKLTATGKSRSVSILNSRVINIREDKKAIAGKAERKDLYSAHRPSGQWNVCK